MTSSEDFTWEGAPVSDEDVVVVAEAVAEDVEEVVETEVEAVSTLSLPEWKAAVKALAKQGFEVGPKSEFWEVRNAVIEFQRSVGIGGVAEGLLTEETLNRLGV
jgi:hypothetical protein